MVRKCIRLNSVTYANKAKAVLKENGIISRMKKTSNDVDGCSYILETEKVAVERAAEILRKSEIKFLVTDRCDYL